MKTTLTFIIVLLNITFVCFGQEPILDKNEKKYSDSVKEWIINNDSENVISNYFSLKNIDEMKLKDFISSYSVSIKNEDLVFNDYNISEKVESEMKVTTFGYRWSNNLNQTLYIIEIKIISHKNKYNIKKIAFVSYDKKLDSFNFPGDEVNKNAFPPTLPPPPGK